MSKIRVQIKRIVIRTNSQPKHHSLPKLRVPKKILMKENEPKGQ